MASFFSIDLILGDTMCPCPDNMTEALIVDAVRSPIGKKNGTLSHIRGDELSAQIVNGLVARNDVDPAQIEDLQWGCVTQVDEQAWNIGRNVALTAGWPVSVCGTTVDRQCGSSMQTNFNAAAAVWSGQLDLVVSGGVEMMSRVPMGSNRGSMSDLVHDRFHIVMQGISAEQIATGVEALARGARPVLVRVARARGARDDEGRFEKEIVPIDCRIRTTGGRALRHATRSRARRETTLEKMAALQPAFTPDGVVDGGELVADRRRLGRRADRVGAEGGRARPASRAAASSVRPRRRRPALMLHGNPRGVRAALARRG